MQDRRTAHITAVTAGQHDQIVHVGKAEISQTGIYFILENRTEFDFNYGSPWDLAYFDNAAGNWVPVEALPGFGNPFWTSEGAMLRAGDINRYRQEWAWRFGELPPGRYMFLRNGWLCEQWFRESEDIYAVVEFIITADCPASLPPATFDWHQPGFISFVEYRNITPYGMTVVIENVSDYDIDNRVQITLVIPQRYAAANDWHDWTLYSLPLPFAYNRLQGIGFLPSGGRLEFELNWEALFGALPPDDYVITMLVGGFAHPPHPTGWGFWDSIIIEFYVLELS